ncbi:MAG: ATP synthase F0 subunit B [Myxococcota bacterium]|nr:ATP synthase F0 subunit B [Myxococcota bacterium]
MLFASLDDGLFAAGSAPQAINVDVDLTFLVQLVLFVALTLVLKPILFDPMLKLFEERERRIDGAKAQARQLDDRSTTALERYETELGKARAEAAVERDKIRAEGLKREQEVLASVRASTAKVLEEGRRKALGEADRVRADLKRDAGVLARDLAKRILGREVQP